MSVMKLCPPKPGSTVMTSSTSSSGASSDNGSTGVLGFIPHPACQQVRGSVRDNVRLIVIVIALWSQYVLKGYPRKFLELLAGTPPHLTLNQVSYHSAESTEEIA